MFCLAYVDDLILSGSSNQHLQQLILSLARQVMIKDLGPPDYFLGLEVVHTNSGLQLSQTKYIGELLAKAQMSTCNVIATPAVPLEKLHRNTGEPLADPTLYRTLVCGLQYLMLTRPDISFSVHQVSQFLHEPTTEHWKALKRILRYLKSTQDHGLLIQCSSNPQLHVHSDSDWAYDKDDRRSVTALANEMHDSWESAVTREQFLGLINWIEAHSREPASAKIYGSGNDAGLAFVASSGQ
ncbi:hypothetical protein GH714_000834 [Hevea brasiliensis]|uniref:Reverse transcriptase Ty1/copia-type domain-containing protein n=1 Tax=Hevea brasiliensis TaxID=3981 RepID=A0A6A6MGU6_HEVBR|nr:hypothetical protein GH714_000834 [Hevea brasiliensis]